MAEGAAAGPRVTTSMVWPNHGGRDPFEDDEDEEEEDEEDEDEDGTYDDYAGYAMAPTPTMPYNRIGPVASAADGARGGNGDTYRGTGHDSDHDGYKVRAAPRAPRVVVSMPRGPEGRGAAPDV